MGNIYKVNLIPCKYNGLQINNNLRVDDKDSVVQLCPSTEFILMFKKYHERQGRRLSLSSGIDELKLFLPYLEKTNTTSYYYFYRREDNLINQSCSIDKAKLSYECYLLSTGELGYDKLQRSESCIDIVTFSCPNLHSIKNDYQNHKLDIMKLVTTICSNQSYLSDREIIYFYETDCSYQENSAVKYYPIRYYKCSKYSSVKVNLDHCFDKEELLPIIIISDSTITMLLRSSMYDFRSVQNMIKQDISEALTYNELTVIYS